MKLQKRLRASLNELKIELKICQISPLTYALFFSFVSFVSPGHSPGGWLKGKRGGVFSLDMRLLDFWVEIRVDYEKRVLLFSEYSQGEAGTLTLHVQWCFPWRTDTTQPMVPGACRALGGRKLSRILSTALGISTAPRALLPSHWVLHMIPFVTPVFIFIPLTLSQEHHKILMCHRHTCFQQFEMSSDMS